MKIKVIIFHHNQPESADSLYEKLTTAFDYVELWDSGSDFDKIPIHVTHSLPNLFAAGMWRKVFAELKDYDAVWIPCADVVLQDEPAKYREAMESCFPFGIWSPCIEGRSHPFMQKVHYGDKQPKRVRNVESQAMAIGGEVLRRTGELVGGKYGFGMDYWFCRQARDLSLSCIIDGRVSIFHPAGTGYNEKAAHDEMEQVFGNKYCSDFRRTIFEYSSSFEGNLYSSQEQPKKETGRMIIFTIDNGWGLADFAEITRQFPEAKKVLMRKGVSPLSNVQEIEVISYNTDLSVFNTDEHIAFFPRIGPANFEDFKRVVALGIPVVANIAYHRDVIVHEKNGFIYQDKTWAGQWLRTLIDNKALRQSIREKSKQMNVEKPMEVSQPSKLVPAPALALVPVQTPPPLVTVITPTFRREPKIVRRSCYSLLLQTVADWEQLVCSDGADEPPIRDLVTSLADPRIQYRHTTTKKSGDFGNTVRSEMLKAARGKYVVFMDDDNVILPDYLEKMVKAVETSGADFAVCRVVHFGPLNESVVGKPPKVLTGFPVKLFHIDSLQVLVKREVMLAVGWDTEKGYTSDGVTLEALGAKYKSVEVTEVLGFHL